MIGTCTTLDHTVNAIRVKFASGSRLAIKLQLDIGKVSAKVLTNRLRKLEFEGIIARSTKPTSPPTVWYGLTLVGQELCAALVNVIDVAQRLKRKEVTTAGTR